MIWLLLWLHRHELFWSDLIQIVDAVLRNLGLLLEVSSLLLVRCLKLTSGHLLDRLCLLLGSRLESLGRDWVDQVHNRLIRCGADKKEEGQ